MKYVVIREFEDLKDNRYLYKVGDKYPRKGRAKAARVAELMSDKNKRGVPLIEEVGGGND